MTKLKNICLVLFVALALPSFVSAAPQLWLDPSSGVVYGNPGTSVGWGFTLTSDISYIVVTGATFTPVTSLGIFEPYIDSLPDLVGPGADGVTPVIQAFDPALRTGVGAFHIQSAAVSGQSVFGLITVNYDVINFDSDGSPFVVDSGTLTSDAGVVVTPEPGSLCLLGSALLLVGFRFRRKK